MPAADAGFWALEPLCDGDDPGQWESPLAEFEPDPEDAGLDVQALSQRWGIPLQRQVGQTHARRTKKRRAGMCQGAEESDPQVHAADTAGSESLRRTWVRELVGDTDPHGLAGPCESEGEDDPPTPSDQSDSGVDSDADAPAPCPPPLLVGRCRL